MSKLIIEGAKGSGKSTIIREVIDKLNEVPNVFHSTQYNLNEMIDRSRNMKDEGTIIYDRFNLGELVYPIVYERKAQLNLWDIHNSIEKMTDRDMYVILHASKQNTLIDRLRERDGLNNVHKMVQVVKSDSIFHAYGTYLTAYWNDKRNVFMIDINNDDELDQLHVLLDNWVRVENEGEEA